MIIYFHCFVLPVLLFYEDESELLHDFIDRIPAVLLFVFSFDKAVDIFFILSAYLLTAQLLQELANSDDINLLRF